MTDYASPDVGGAIRELVAGRLAGARRPDLLPDDLSLGPAGAGFDSVALVEVILACEERFAVKIPPELFEAGVPTIGALAEAVERARQAGNAGSPSV